MGTVTYTKEDTKPNPKDKDKPYVNRSMSIDDVYVKLGFGVELPEKSRAVVVTVKDVKGKSAKTNQEYHILTAVSWQYQNGHS